MKTWTPEEISKAVAASGKPLEVTSAQAFLRANGWTATLGTYFEERNTLKPPRELDVLATREITIEGDRNTQLTCRVQALVSCKGFTDTQLPIGYSLLDSSVPALPPGVGSQHRARQNGHPDETYGRVMDFEASAASLLLKTLNLAGGRSLVALDIIDAKKEKKLVGDRELFEGVDSAMKAAFYWQGAHLNEGGYFIGLYVPVLVLRRPLWEVPIDEGILGNPTESRRGYLTCRYPKPDHSLPRSPTVDVTVFIVSREDLDALVRAFDDLFTWLAAEGPRRFGKDAPLRT